MTTQQEGAYRPHCTQEIFTSVGNENIFLLNGYVTLRGSSNYMLTLSQSCLKWIYCREKF